MLSVPGWARSEKTVENVFLTLTYYGTCESRSRLRNEGRVRFIDLFRFYWCPLCQKKIPFPKISSEPIMKKITENQAKAQVFLKNTENLRFWFSVYYSYQPLHPGAFDFYSANRIFTDRCPAMASVWHLVQGSCMSIQIAFFKNWENGEVSKSKVKNQEKMCISLNTVGTASPAPVWILLRYVNVLC